jgi:hypothetical protein
MRVYVLLGCEAYEGDVILGVYSSRELAFSAREDYSSRFSEGIDSFDELDVREMELDAGAVACYSYERL